MIEKDLQQSLYIQRILSEDIELFSKKLIAQKRIQEDQTKKVAQIESQASIYRLTNTKTIDMFNKLSDLESKLQDDLKVLSKNTVTKSKLRQEKIHMIRRLIESKSREITMIDSEDKAIQRSIYTMQQVESNRDLHYIEMIAKKEKEKIAVITGRKDILSQSNDYLNMQDSEGISFFSNKNSSAGIRRASVTKINREPRQRINPDSLVDMKW